MQRFLNWIILRRENVSVVDAICANNNNTLLNETKDFGICQDSTLFRNHSCYQCSGGKSHSDCIKQSCVTEQVCFSRMEFANDSISFYKGCTSDAICTNREKQNVNSCYNSSGLRNCYFCCLDKNCNDNTLGRRTKEILFYIPVTMSELSSSYFSLGYNTSVTASLDNMQNNILSNFSKSSCFFSNSDILVKKVGPPQLTIYFKASCTTLNEYKENEITMALDTYLKGLSTDSGFPQTIVNISVYYGGTGVCESEETGNYVINGVWPATQYGDTAQIYCADKVIVKRNCTQYGWLPPPNITQCSIKQGITNNPSTIFMTVTASLPSLEEIAKRTVDDESADEIAEQLFKQTMVADKFTDREINITVSLLEDLEGLQSTFITRDRERNIVKIMSNILNTTETQLNLSEEKFQSASRLLDSVQKLSNSTNILKEDFKEIASNIGIMATAINRTEFNGISLASLDHPSEELNLSNLILTKNGTVQRDSTSWIILPRQLLSELPSNSSPTRVTLTAFKNDKIFRALRSNAKDPNTVEGIVYRLQPNSIIVAAQVPGVQVEKLLHPIEMRFQQNSKTKENATATCGYFLEAGRNKGFWSNRGCKVKVHRPGEYTECQCNHLTNFALLMDVYRAGGKISETNKRALTYLSYLGCGISLIGLTLTLITYCMFRKLRSTNPGKILINLCFAITGTDLIFLVGQQEYTLKSELGCKIIAASLHYFLLSAMCWMLIEAYYLYVALIQVFNTHISRFILKTTSAGWGTPLVIVAVTLGVSTENYGTQGGGICWLKPVAFYAAFLVPVGIIMIINLIIFALVLHRLSGAASKNLNKIKATKTSSRLRRAATLVFMLGLTWLFGILTFNGGVPVFQYLFTIFNSLQGLFIFVFQCLLKADVQEAWKRTCCDGYKDKISKTSKGYPRSREDRSTVDMSSMDIKARHRGGIENDVSNKTDDKEHSALIMSTTW
ncbi:adhesion G-protein coupled receptor G6-like [Saccostrea cucullata]|uniref:adhesion G-protein coupled receptor G6-like n=1 Tax=Saccostrea cuccullata TaxID=36930 RepID=UPI002ED60201